MEKWSDHYTQACEATHVKGDQSDEVLDLRMGCLKKRLGEFGALAKIFTKADAGVVQKAVQASASLTGINTCADEKALRAPYPPPKTKEAKAKVAAIREKLTEVEALTKTGKYQKALELAKKLKEQANAVEYMPVKAQVLYRLGVLLERVGEYKKSENTLQDAARIAGESGNALLVAKAMIYLVRVVGYHKAQHETALSISNDAEAVLSLGGGDSSLRSQLFNNVGIVFDEQGEYDKALEYYQKTLSIRERFLGAHHSEVAHPLNNIGVMFWNMGNYDKALEYYRKSLVIREKTLGPEHPLVATTLSNIGLVYWKMSNYKQALKHYRRSLIIRETALGPKHPLIATTLSNMGLTFSSQGKYDKAHDYLNRSLAIRSEALGTDHPIVTWSLSGIGNVYIDQGMPKRALSPLEKVAALCGKITCDPDPYGRGLFGLARALIATSGDKTTRNQAGQTSTGNIRQDIQSVQERTRRSQHLATETRSIETSKKGP